MHTYIHTYIHTYRLLREMNTLRPKLSAVEVELASKAAVVERLEADLQQHKFLLGEAQGKCEKLSGQVEGYKAEVGSLRMQVLPSLYVYIRIYRIYVYSMYV
jgi:predicted  nucleic acid-binding Zn-ribbon protein